MTEYPGRFVVQQAVRGPWRQFLDDVVPVRPELYRYCLKLTGSTWDAEDLVQDALLRVFSSLGKSDRDIKDPKAYLIRTATNLWVDTIRRQARNQPLREVEDEADDEGEIGVAATEAGRELLSRLYPQERAALVLKEVLGYSLKETADELNTSVGAVKDALRRARSGLKGQDLKPASFAPNKDMVERFMKALATSDLDGLRSICAADLHVELVGGAEFHTFDDSSDFFAHAHFVMPEIGFGENPRWELAEFDAEYIVVGYRTLAGVEGLNEIHRLEVNADKISRVRCYCFCPDTLREVGKALGTPALARPYRSPSP